MELCRCRGLALVILLLIVVAVPIFEEEEENIGGGRSTIMYSAAAVASPLSGTKIQQPWVDPADYWALPVHPAQRYIPTDYDVHDDARLKKLLNVGACSSSNSTDRRYVPPLDGADADGLLCQDNYGMRFMLFDLQLVSVDSVDVLSGSFTAQLQLVFYWREGWEENQTALNAGLYVYSGDPITTSENVSMCGFVCDSTSTTKSTCCDRLWVPPFQLPSCKLNNVDSTMETPTWITYYPTAIPSFWPPYEGGFVPYDARRVWYVGIDVTCPFTPDFHNFPFDYQFLTLDIVNPYASHTWLQLNRGFLQANIINSIADHVELNPNRDIDGWRITDFIVSSACGTQQTWVPTLATQDDLLQFLGDGYKSQSETITDLLVERRRERER